MAFFNLVKRQALGRKFPFYVKLRISQEAVSIWKQGWLSFLLKTAFFVTILTKIDKRHFSKKASTFFRLFLMFFFSNEKHNHFLSGNLNFF